MSFNGSGSFLINTAGQPVVSGTVISSTAFNALTADLATGLSTCITKDGQTTVTANIPMATYKFTGLGAGSAAADSANLSQVQSTVVKLLASVSGTDTITAVGSPTVAAYAAGQMFYFVAAGDNTGAVTLNIDSLGAKAVTRDGSVALAASDIKSGEVVVVVYDGTRFQVVSQLNSSGDARFANVSIASSLYVGGVATIVGNAGFSANVSITSALSVGATATITGGATIQTLTVGLGAGAVASNTAVGYQAAYSNTTGASNVAVGYQAGYTGTTAGANTAIGWKALYSNSTGGSNTAVGYEAGLSTTGGTNSFFGTQAGRTNTSGASNTAIGTYAYYSGTTAANNTALGYYTLGNNSTGSSNTALGQQAMYLNTTGANNVSVGALALYNNTTASNNTAVGYTALYANTTGTQNAAVGYQAGYANTTGTNNVAVGFQALSSITTNGNSTAVGAQALASITTSQSVAFGGIAGKSTTSGGGIAAFGYGALTTNTTGVSNTAIGTSYNVEAALEKNTTGSYNVAVGEGSLAKNTTASYNAAVGYQAGYNSTGGNNTFLGYYAGQGVTTGTFNTFVGVNGAGYLVTTGGKNTIIGGYSGNQGGLDIRTSSNNIVISDGDGTPCVYIDVGSGTYLTNALGTGAGTNTVKFNTTSKELTYDTSSARYKDNIRDSVYGLSHVMQLRSTMFEYKKESRTDVGLIAEEVVNVIPELVATDGEGRPDAVSYDRMVSVLVKAIQELKAEFDAYKASHP